MNFNEELDKKKKVGYKSQEMICANCFHRLKSFTPHDVDKCKLHNFHINNFCYCNDCTPKRKES